MTNELGCDCTGCNKNEGVSNPCEEGEDMPAYPNCAHCYVRTITGGTSKVPRGCYYDKFSGLCVSGWHPWEESLVSCSVDDKYDGPEDDCYSKDREHLTETTTTTLAPPPEFVWPPPSKYSCYGGCDVVLGPKNSRRCPAKFGLIADRAMCRDMASWFQGSDKHFTSLMERSYPMSNPAEFEEDGKHDAIAGCFLHKEYSHVKGKHVYKFLFSEAKRGKVGRSSSKRPVCVEWSLMAETLKLADDPNCHYYRTECGSNPTIAKYCPVMCSCADAVSGGQCRSDVDCADPLSRRPCRHTCGICDPSKFNATTGIAFGAEAEEDEADENFEEQRDKNLGKPCLEECGNQGLCEGFCGEARYCCKEGEEGEAAGDRACMYGVFPSSTEHVCVKLDPKIEEEPAFKPTSPYLDTVLDSLPGADCHDAFELPRGFAYISGAWSSAFCKSAFGADDWRDDLEGVAPCLLTHTARDGDGNFIGGVFLGRFFKMVKFTQAGEPVEKSGRYHAGSPAAASDMVEMYSKGASVGGHYHFVQGPHFLGPCEEEAEETACVELYERPQFGYITGPWTTPCDKHFEKHTWKHYKDNLEKVENCKCTYVARVPDGFIAGWYHGGAYVKMVKCDDDGNPVKGSGRYFAGSPPADAAGLAAKYDSAHHAGDHYSFVKGPNFEPPCKSEDSK